MEANRRPTRRTLLTLTASGVAALGGCLESGDDTSGPAENETTQSGEVPSHPTSFEDDVLREFVAQYEQAVLYERYRGNYAGSGTSVSVGCQDTDAMITHADGDHWYVSMYSCTLNSSSDGPNGAGSDQSDPVLYLVTEDDVTRVDPRTDTHDDPYVGEEQLPNDGYGVWTSNFDDEAHELSVTITHREGPADPVLERTFDLAPGRGIHLKHVAGHTGEYDWDVQLADGSRATETIAVTGEQFTYFPMGAALVTPAGGLVIDDVEFAR